MWCLKFEVPNSGMADFTIFNSEKEAFQYAACELQDYIFDELNMEHDDNAEVAKQINAYIINDEYERAISYWNDCDMNKFNDNEPRFWMVYEISITTGVQSPRIFSQSYLNCKDEEDEDPPIVIQAVAGSKAFQATTSGATCRGPHKEYNSYAYADEPGGTYLCHQCKMFNHVFGGIKN